MNLQEIIMFVWSYFNNRLIRDDIYAFLYKSILLLKMLFHLIGAFFRFNRTTFS